MSADHDPGTYLDYFRLFFDDGIGDVELMIGAWFIDGTNFIGMAF